MSSKSSGTLSFWFIKEARCRNNGQRVVRDQEEWMSLSEAGREGGKKEGQRKGRTEWMEHY